MEQKEKKVSETYLGSFGAFLPLIVMIGTMVTLVAFGMRSTKNFWSAGFLSVIAGFLVYKNKKDFQTALVGGIRDNVFAFIVACLLLAGVLAKILTASHLIDALMWGLLKLHFPAKLMPLFCFLICVVLSVATGSAASSINTAGPLMIPLAVAMGCKADLVCGAILAGACFGDNLAPISDTTIASSLSQEIDVGKVVKSRFKYSIIAGVISAVLYVILGIATTIPASAQLAAGNAEYASSLVFLLLPILVVILMLKGSSIFTSLLIAEILGILMLFCFGYATPASLFDKSGLIASGFDSMLTASLFLLFIFVMVSLIQNAGCLDKILNFMSKRAKTDRSAEIAAGAMVSVVGIAVSSGTSAIAFCGPIVRKLLKPFKIDRARAANIVDGLGCGVGYLVPTNAGCLNLASLAIAAGVVSEGYNPISFVVYNFHSMALFLVFWLAILTGWGLKHEEED